MKAKRSNDEEASMTSGRRERPYRNGESENGISR